MTPRREVALLLAAIVAACGTGREDEVDTSEYAQPSYTDVRADAASTPVRLSDVTADAGIEFLHVTGAFGDKWMPETMGSGGGFFDYDGDGRPDLFLVNGSEWDGHRTGAPATPRLYRNVDGTRFEDVSSAAGLTMSVYGMGMAAADYDGDGDTDVYVTAVGDNLLLRNDGGTFVDVASRLGVLGNGERPGTPPAWSTGAAWVDVDRDGWLDLFVCNYVQWTPDTDLFTTLDGTTKSYATPEQYQGESCRLYANRAGRRFADVTREAGVLNHDGKSLGVAVEDVDDNGWPDLVVANDVQPNALYVNDGDGTFTDVAVQAGVAFDEIGRARAGMGVDVADLGGGIAIGIGNFSREPISLYTKIGPGLFQDRAGGARITRASLLPLTFGLLFVDLDLDGDLDLLAGNGHIEPDINAVQQDVTFAQPPLAFANDGAGRFTEIGAELGGGFADPIVARGIAAADIDGDADLDVLLTVNAGAPRLFRNDLPGPRRALRLYLSESRSNRAAIGAVVTAYVGDRVIRRMVRTGSSYLSQSAVLPVIVGLGEAEAADSLTVRWPTSGRTDRFDAVADGSYAVRFAEPTTLEPMRTRP